MTKNITTANYTAATKVIHHRGLVIFILGLLSALGPFSIDMYLPAFDDIATGLHTTKDMVGYSLSSYFIGISVGQLLYGPLLDRYGRKLMIYTGLIIYIISSVLIIYVQTAEQLILMRLFQAIGGCVGMVGSRALVRDLFPVRDIAKIFSYLMLVIAISPIIAPTVGGFMASYFGWSSIFTVLAAIAGITLIGLYFFVPDGNPPDTEMSLKPRPIIQKFIKVSKVPRFYTYALVSAISSSGLYAYLAASPTIFYDIFHVSTHQYGIIFAIIAIGMTAANQSNTFLLRKYSSEKISKINLFLQIIVGIILVITTFNNGLNLYTTIALIWVYMATQGFVYPNTSALSIAPFSRSAGTASAWMGAIQLGIGAITTALISTFMKTSVFPLALTILICATLSTLILYILGKKINPDGPTDL